MVTNYRTMQEIVYDTLREAILAGKYPPGFRLVTDDIAKELGVSRMPVREALHRLEVSGVVTIIPHRGAEVSQLSIDKIIEIYHIRAVLDGLATRLAAPNLSASDLKKLDDLLSEMDEAAIQKDSERVLAVNRRFHVIIWEAARSPRLRELLENLYDTSQRYRNLSVVLPGRMEIISQDHRRIVQALEEGNVEEAEKFAIEHHESTAQRLLNSIRATKE